MFSLKSGSICWKASTTHGFSDSTWNWFQFQAQWVNSESMHDLVHMRWCHCLMSIVGSSLSPSGHIAIACSSILVEFIDCTYQVDNPSWVKKLSSQSFVQVLRDMGPSANGDISSSKSKFWWTQQLNETMKPPPRIIHQRPRTRKSCCPNGINSSSKTLRQPDRINVFEVDTCMRQQAANVLRFSRIGWVGCVDTQCQVWEVQGGHGLMAHVLNRGLVWSYYYYL